MRRVELWSVFRLSILGFLALYVITLGAFALLWWIASNTGTVHNLEKFLRDVGFKNFHFDGPQLMGGFAAVGAVLVLAGTLLATVMAALFNVLSEMTGGVGVVVIEEAPVSAQPPGETRLPASVAGDVGVAHESASGGSTPGRGAPTTAARSVGSNGGEDTAADSGMVQRARSVMGVAAGKVRRSVREAARGLAGDGNGAGGSAAVASGDGAAARGGDGRGGAKDSAADSGEGAAARGGDGRGGDGRGGAKDSAADSRHDPAEDRSTAGAAARSGDGRASE